MKSKDSNLSCSSNYTSILFPGLYTIILNFFIFLKYVIGDVRLGSQCQIKLRTAWFLKCDISPCLYLYVWQHSLKLIAISVIQRVNGILGNSHFPFS